MKSSRHLFLTVAGALTVATAFSTPSIPPSSVSLVQDPDTRVVKVSYTLSDGPAIVTAEFLTNGVSIGRAASRNVWGDVNKIVRAADCTFRWQPRKAWPNRELPENTLSVRLTAWAMDAAPDYMVIDLTAPRADDRDTVSFHPSEDSLPFEITNRLYKTDRLVMRKIPADGVRWMMGGAETEFNYQAKWETRHYVTLTNDYFMAVYPVTQAQYAWFMGGEATCVFPGPDRPVDTISYVGLRGSTSGHDWPDDGHAVAEDSVMGILSSYTDLDGFDLPTDAEWEYACRAGCPTAFYDGTTLKVNEWEHPTLTNLAWTADNAGGQTHPVGLKTPNGFGLYDMLGNVAEWVLDWAVENHYGSAEVTAPSGGSTGTARFLRGGGWPHDERTNRIGSHQYQGPTSGYISNKPGSCGFRPVIPASFK